MSGHRAPFTAYRLPLPRRRQGPAAIVSLLLHGAVALAVLWRGAVLFAGSGRGSGPPGGGGGRPPVRWFTLPAASAPQTHEVPAAPAVSLATLALPDPAKIDVPQLQPAPPVVVTPAAGAGEGRTGGPGQGQGPGSGAGQGSGTGTDVGPGSGGEGGYIFPASPRWTIFPPPGAPAEVRGRRYEVRFWVTAEGRVTRVVVSPPIKDGAYRREFVERMMGYLFNPATTRDGRRVDFVATVTVIP